MESLPSRYRVLAWTESQTLVAFTHSPGALTNCEFIWHIPSDYTALSKATNSTAAKPTDFICTPSFWRFTILSAKGKSNYRGESRLYATVAAPTWRRNNPFDSSIYIDKRQESKTSRQNPCSRITETNSKISPCRYCKQTDQRAGNHFRYPRKHGKVSVSGSLNGIAQNTKAVPIPERRLPIYAKTVPYLSESPVRMLLQNSKAKVFAPNRVPQTQKRSKPTSSIR